MSTNYNSLNQPYMTSSNKKSKLINTPKIRAQTKKNSVQINKSFDIQISD